MDRQFTKVIKSYWSEEVLVLEGPKANLNVENRTDKNNK